MFKVAVDKLEHEMYLNPSLVIANSLIPKDKLEHEMYLNVQQSDT